MARKTWRDLVWALAAALCGWPLAACTRTSPGLLPAEPRVSLARRPAAVPESPYHGLSSVAEAQAGSVKATSAPAPLVRGDTLPPVLPPELLPPPSALTEKPAEGARLDPPAEELLPV